MREISLHMLDIIQNSIKAEATKLIIEINARDEYLEIIIEDNGKGIESQILKNIKDPFVTSRTTRDVGFGISLFETSCEMAGGELTIESELGKGTIVKGAFLIKHIDRIPLGDVASTITSVIADKPDVDIELIFNNKNDRFEFSTTEVKKQIKELSINNYEVTKWIREYINEGIEEIFGGVLDEIIS